MNRRLRRAAAGSGGVAAAEARNLPPLLGLAQAAHRDGRLDEADALCARHLAASPGHAQALHLRGEVARLQGRPADAIAHFTAALVTAPTVAAVHDGLADAFRSAGQPVDAERHYRRVAELRPGSVTLLNHGNALMELGRPADAAATFRNALRVDPRLPELHYALGTALGALQQGQAVDAFRRAVSLRPDFVLAHEGLVEACLAAGNGDAALRAVCHALERMDTTRLRVLFVDCVREAVPTREMAGLEQATRRALAERWTRPQELAPAACAVALLRQPLDVRGEPLRTLLELAPVCHRTVEQALTAQRRVLLDAVGSGAALPPEALDTACGLAGQCFINEYAWFCTPDEAEAVERLCRSVEDALDNETVVPELTLAVIAAYRPLGGLAGADRLLGGSWSPQVATLLARQVEEPAEEKRLRGVIRRGTAIGNAVSQAVRDQYEANPYPRWVATIDAAERIRLGDWLAARFPGAPAAALPDRTLEVLVAGCGTGQHAVETVRGLASVDVLAIDLSLSSLAYASRVTAALEVGGIEYVQADLLEAAELGRRFDMIAVGGVLHHMADPWAGWRALLGLLRPGGVMNVLLYTRRGRGDVRTARDWIAAEGYEPTPDGIRACRHALMARPEDWAVRLSASPDCCSASGCRDLLFHVQEGAVTLPEVARFLEAEGIRLLGVDVSAATEQLFRERNPGADGLRDLSCWDLFEAENPRCFAGMLNLWVQKDPAAAKPDPGC